MVATILPATTADEKMRVTVWLRVPSAEPMSARWSEQQRRFVVSYPAGTVADRVSFMLRGSSWDVEDVRGTTFSPHGEIFHVLRPDPKGTDAVVGVEWNRDDRAGEDVARRAVGILACREGDADVDFVRARTACPRCHMHDKRESRIDIGGDTPFRATDDGGLYETLSVLTDDVEINDARGRDVNVDDKFVSLHCKTGNAEIVRSANGEVHVQCPARDEVPMASYDVAAALRNGDPHARDVCASRAYLYEHADRALRSAFSRAFQECELASRGRAAKSHEGARRGDRDIPTR